MTLLLEGGRLVCTETGLDRQGDLWVQDGRISTTAPSQEVDEVIDCRGLVVTPALVDLDTRLSDPGLTWREDMGTAGQAAIRGGFTTLLASPEADPVTDGPALVRELLSRSERECPVQVLSAAALTCKLEGKDLAELGLMLEAGAAVLSNAQRLVTDSLVLRNALLYARPFDRPVLLRAGDAELESVAVMHEGEYSALAGLRGLPAAAEELGMARLIALARYTGTHIHVLGVSTALAVEQLRRAKAEGVNISGSTTALHCLLEDREVLESGYDSNTRLNPPLRSASDREAVCRGLVDGTLLGAASAHSPLTRVEKELEYAYAEPGALGLETALGALLSVVDLRVALRALSSGPARLLGLQRALVDGAPAELVAFDPSESWTVDPQQSRSRSRNEPLAGRSLPGNIQVVVHQGRRVL
ncbi:MAG: dihydroorotase [Myxococcota bacterium]|nr:dihydroorotase [Myxococcota bacterium]